MLKRAIVRLLYLGCAVIDHTPSAILPARVRRLGCPSGLALRAARLEERWGLEQPPAGSAGTPVGL